MLRKQCPVFFPQNHDPGVEKKSGFLYACFSFTMFLFTFKCLFYFVMWLSWFFISLSFILHRHCAESASICSSGSRFTASTFPQFLLKIISFHLIYPNYSFPSLYSSEILLTSPVFLDCITADYLHLHLTCLCELFILPCQCLSLVC